MKKLPKQYANFTLTLFFIGWIGMLLAKADSSQAVKPENTIREARELRFQNPDSSIHSLEHHYVYALAEHDTLTAINALMGLASTYGHQAHYKESYDRLWTALSLADAANLHRNKAHLYRSLGRYYSFYSRKENAVKFLQFSLDITKDLISKDELDNAVLAQNYHAFAATYRELNEPLLGQTYLDSSFWIHKPERSLIHRSYLEFEQAVLHYENHEYQQARILLKKVLAWFADEIPSYQVLVYHYLGATHFALKEYAESERCFRLSLAISQRYNSHIDFTPLIYEKLSELCFAQGKLGQAFENQKIAKELDREFFDSRSENNRPFLEIQDDFREEQEEKTRIMQEQRLAKLEQEDRILLLQRTLLLGSLIFLLGFGVLLFYFFRSKHRSEKRLIQKQQELEIQKTQEIVELKNKELATFALKLIEKDSFIETIKETLSQGKGEIKRHEMVQLVNMESNSEQRNWEEFEARFVSVNNRFYESLLHQFPALTQGDLKLCALLKLNFSSKEMAKLLGMSVDSVHTTRHRLRKKLKLPKGANLKEFIAAI